MISSCVFTFDESSKWDPKVIRKHLDIPEDQSNILRNLPEWSKHNVKGKAFRLEKDIAYESSQSSPLLSSTALVRNEDLIKRNIELFDKSFETRKSILETYKIKPAKLSRSLSLFEIYEISNKLSCNSHLRSFLSVPDIYLFSENLCSKNINSEFRSRDSSSERHLSSLNKNIDSALFKETQIIKHQTNKGILEFAKNEGKTCSEKSNMEVNSQLSVLAPSFAKQVKNKDTNIEIVVENNAIPTSHTLKSSNKSNTSSSDQPTFPASSDVTISDVNIKATSDTMNLDKENENFCLVIENTPSNRGKPEVNAKITKLTESVMLKLSGENDPDLNIVEEKSCLNMDKNKRDEANSDFQELSKVNETPIQCSKSSDISKKLCMSQANLASPNETENKIPCNSSIPQLNVENAQQIIQKDVSCNKSVLAETLSIKRKLESKNRSLKKRRKGHNEGRSMKKAGEITYSVEHIKTMLDIMKQFI